MHISTLSMLFPDVFNCRIYIWCAQYNLYIRMFSDKWSVIYPSRWYINWKGLYCTKTCTFDSSGRFIIQKCKKGQWNLFWCLEINDTFKNEFWISAGHKCPFNRPACLKERDWIQYILGKNHEVWATILIITQVKISKQFVWNTRKWLSRCHKFYHNCNCTIIVGNFGCAKVAVGVGENSLLITMTSNGLKCKKNT